MKQIFTGQLTSYAKDRNVVQQIWEGVPATFSLCIGAAVLWMSLAILFGYLSAVHAGRFTDRALTILSLVGISMPVFWLAAMLLYFLSFKVELFPTGSYVPFTDDPVDWAYHLILPWFTLAVLFVGIYSRVLRSNMRLLGRLGAFAGAGQRVRHAADGDDRDDRGHPDHQRGHPGPRPSRCLGNRPRRRHVLDRRAHLGSR